MRTCFNTATSGKYPLKDTIDLLGKYGYEGVEIDTARLDEYLAERSLDDLKAQLVRNKVEVAALMAFALDPFGDYGPVVEKIAEYAPIGRDLGAATLLTYCGAGIPEGMSEDEAFKRAGEVAAEYGDVAAESGLTIALEPIGRAGLMPGPVQALRIAKESGRDSVGIMMDTFHYYKSEVPMDDIRAIPGGRLHIVHVNDSLQLPPAKLKDSHRVYCGHGILPLHEYFSILKSKIGYQGFLSVEIFNRDYWEDEHENIVRFSKAALDKVLAGV